MFRLSKRNMLNNFANLSKFHKFTQKFNLCNKFYSDNFLTGESAFYVENVYNQWRKDKNSVDSSWDVYFTKLDEGSLTSNTAYKEYSSSGSSGSSGISDNNQNKALYMYERNFKLDSTNSEKLQTDEDTRKVLLLIRSYQRNGFLKANLDPLGLDLLDSPVSHYTIYESRSTLDYKSYGFTEGDLDREFIIHTEKLSGILSEKRPMKLREILDRLNRAYCGTIGPDYLYISSREECNFIREKFEVEWAQYKASKQEKVTLFDRLCWAVLFEEFLQKKFGTHKWFGLEGMESMISGLKCMVDECVERGVRDVTLGMAHRGRLNVLANVMRKPMNMIFAEFQGKELTINGEREQNPEIEYTQTGDVKYHLGTFHERSYGNGRNVSMDLLPNPSHLEAVDPVVMGKVRAKQCFNSDEEERKKYLCVLIHGDAAFAGQGIIYESMQMENLQNYTVGGTIHIVANNQIGFTTSPKDGRSTPFVSDILKAYESPIIHVNADDPIAVNYSFKVAAEYRMKYKKDIVVDLIGYRKRGHNELDQPMFTQPLMYKAIAKKKNVLELFMQRVIEGGDMTREECERNIERIKEKLTEDFKKAENNLFEKKEWISKQWAKLDNTKYSEPKITGVEVKKLRELSEKMNLLPGNYHFHKMIKKIYENRYNTVETGKNIDMATAEALSWASLIDEGYTVRLSGQDVERGTFSQRHSVLHDQEEDKKYVPIQSVAKDPKLFQPCNSHLSEYSVLGYELGFSYYNPHALVTWEAQFGDFSNGAQIIIDNFIASGERKWNAQTGIVLNLPHGMDGQGPEHSSCKLERFLAMMDDDINDISYLGESDKITQIQECNYQVCYPTTSANYFHLFRRQLKRDFRKPLILALSKKLLKFRFANSDIEEFDETKRFLKVREELNEEVLKNAGKVKNILACSGQVYYDLIQRREQMKRNDIAIIAVEQIGPFPYSEFLDAIEPFPNARLTWVQEEHVNQGAWEYVRSRINNIMKISNRQGELHYVGRGPNSAASTGIRAIFEREHQKLLEDAFQI